MKKSKVKTEWHAPKSPIGSGDYYGTGIKQKVGTIRDVYPVDYSPKTLSKKPPKSLA